MTPRPSPRRAKTRRYTLTLRRRLPNEHLLIEDLGARVSGRHAQRIRALLLVWAWLAALQTGTALVGAPVTDRLSKRTLTLLNWASLAFGYGALAFASSPVGLWVAVSIYGLLSGISEGVERALISELAEPEQKGTAFGWYYMISGLAAIPAGLLFGLVWKLAGPAAAFGLTALVALVSAARLKLSVHAGSATGG